MSQFTQKPIRKFLTSFASLNLTQFFTAFNDNLYKLLLVFFLINLKGEEHSNTILSLAGAVFVIPFLLFASLAGTLADRYSKRSIIFFTRFLEILITCLAVVSFYFKSVWGGYVVLFLMAFLSTIFSPCKYGIIPEIVKKERISNCNGIITASTYLAIILGTFFASFLTQATHKNFVLTAFVCVIVALLGAFSSMGIEKTPPQAAKKKISVKFISEIYRTLKKANEKRYLLTTIVFGAYFFFIGAYTQLNIIPFALQSLHLTDVHGGYLFLLTAVGIGIGSYLAGKFSGSEVELGFVPLAALGVMFCLIGLYFFETRFFVVAPLLILLGVCGGFYAVPIDSFIQAASPNKDRGQNVAAANFLSFGGVIIASFLIALLGNGLHLSAAQGFLTVGILTFFIALALVILYADQLLRLCISIVASLFWDLRISGKKRVDGQPILYVAPRLSWLDTLIVMATLPRLVHYIVPLPHNLRKRSPLYRLLSLIPVENTVFGTLGQSALRAIKKELSGKNSVCLMLPLEAPPHSLKEWEEFLKNHLNELGYPIMPVHISHRVLPDVKSSWQQFANLRKGPIKISYGHPQRAIL